MVPDLLVFAKGVGSGMPISGVATRSELVANQVCLPAEKKRNQSHSIHRLRSLLAILTLIVGSVWVFRRVISSTFKKKGTVRQEMTGILARSCNLVWSVERRMVCACACVRVRVLVRQCVYA